MVEVFLRAWSSALSASSALCSEKTSFRASLRISSESKARFWPYYG
jgi:hypothetical protein